MQDFPARRTALKFAWPAGVQDMTLESDYARVIGAQVVRASMAKEPCSAGCSGARAFHWVVTYEPPIPRNTSWMNCRRSRESRPAFMRALADLLLQCHDIELIDHRREDGAPDFHEALDRVNFMKRARREGDTLLQALPSAGTHAAALAANLAAVLKSASARNLAEAHAALDFNLEAGTWPGATLEQGVWYQMEMPLPLPYAPLLLINHRVEFAFTRPVACSSEAATASCVEIVMHAVPDPSDLQIMLDETQRSAHLPHGRELRSAASTTIRWVTDPDTLISYRREIHRQGYLSGDGTPNGALFTEERIVIAGGPVAPAAD